MQYINNNLVWLSAGALLDGNIVSRLNSVFATRASDYDFIIQNHIQKEVRQWMSLA